MMRHTVGRCPRVASILGYDRLLTGGQQIAGAVLPLTRLGRRRGVSGWTMLPAPPSRRPADWSANAEVGCEPCPSGQLRLDVTAVARNAQVASVPQVSHADAEQFGR